MFGIGRIVRRSLVEDRQAIHGKRYGERLDEPLQAASRQGELFHRQSSRSARASAARRGTHSRRRPALPACDKLEHSQRAIPTMASIWKKPAHANVAALTAIHVNTTASHLGIEFLEVGDDFVRARAPVDARTRQPMGILHGGVSVVLAETLGSCCAYFASSEGHRAVGLDINANHLRSVSEGWVTGVARPVHIGRTTHVWQM